MRNENQTKRNFSSQCTPSNNKLKSQTPDFKTCGNLVKYDRTTLDYDTVPPEERGYFIAQRTLAINSIEFRSNKRH